MGHSDADRHDTFRRAAVIHLDALYRFARRIADGDIALAEDLVQETFLQAWRSFDSFELGTNCRAWLYRILLNCWSHEQRRRSRHPVVVDSDAVEREPLVFDPPPATDITAEEVVAAFEKLPQEFQVVVLLADVEELTYREIAEVLAVPIGTVMSRLSRGRRLLRVELARYARDFGFGPPRRARSGDDE
jgi:RNA polymerase sigma-70 factor (ECF subfamily)